jgi:hypothetical protein
MRVCDELHEVESVVVPPKFHLSLLAWELAQDHVFLSLVVVVPNFLVHFLELQVPKLFPLLVGYGVLLDLPEQTADPVLIFFSCKQLCDEILFSLHKLDNLVSWFLWEPKLIQETFQEVLANLPEPE